jgi:uncharacterized SAM-binding protein YcdF (DUF218 family)
MNAAPHRTEQLPPCQPWWQSLGRVLAALVGVALLTDGVWLMLLDKINFGTVLPTVIGGGLCLWAWQRDRLRKHLQRTPRLARCWRVAVYGFFAWVLSLAVFFVNIYSIAGQGANAAPAPTAIVVLGSGLLGSQPTPTLQARLNTAIEHARRYPEIPILTAGGLGRYQTITEAQAMADYLIANGVSPQRLILENRSVSTHQNLLFAKPLLPANANILLITSDFHMRRSQAIARKLGLSVVRTASAPTPLQIRYNAWLREYFAFISGWLLNEY